MCDIIDDDGTKKSQSLAERKGTTCPAFYGITSPCVVSRSRLQLETYGIEVSVRGACGHGFEPARLEQFVSQYWNTSRPRFRDVNTDVRT
jgi:hypothetical protein